MKIKNKGLWTILALVLACLTIRAVFSMSGELSVPELFREIRDAKPGWMLLAAAFMTGIIFFEGEAIRGILREMGYTRSMRKGFVYGAADVYFSAITPSASGGQPASAFFMVKDGVPVTIATAVLILNLVMYTLAILSISVVCILANPVEFLNFAPLSRVLIALGFAALSGLAVLFYMLLRHQRFLFGTARMLVRFLTGRRLVRHPENLLTKLEKSELEYRDCVVFMHGHTRMLVNAYFCNLFQRLSQFFVILSVYMAAGGKVKLLPRLFVTQCYIILGSNCVPVPGGMGVTDYLMLDGYGHLFDRAASYRLEMLGRGLTFYCCVLVSALTILAAYVLLQKRQEKERGASWK